MAKSKCVVGFVHTVRKKGVSVEEVTEKGPYTADLPRASRTLTQSENTNPDVTMSNTAEIIADAYARDNIFAIRYIKWAGVCWTVTEVTVQRPRLLLRLGGVYNGRRATDS